MTRTRIKTASFTCATAARRHLADLTGSRNSLLCSQVAHAECVVLSLCINIVHVTLYIFILCYSVFMYVLKEVRLSFSCDL